MTADLVTESALSFDCEGHTLAGILHAPARPCDVGVVVIVGGPQYRAGSHRQFVLLARDVASAGFAVLRFDYRGMGDSDGARRGFDAVTADVGAALTEFQLRVPAVRRVVLWGLCDGASAALLYLDDTHDSRVSGLCLLNPWVRSDASLARTYVKHYYARRLGEREFWAKLLGGRVGARAWRALVANVRDQARARDTSAALSYQQRMARAWESFRGRVLLVLSGDDYTAKEFIDVARQDAAWSGSLRHPHVQRHDLPGVDHTFSTGGSGHQVSNLTVQWLLALSERVLAPTEEVE